MMPTADQVACVIIAACRETGEPVPFNTLAGHHQERWRHYVVHALHAKFPLCPPSALGRMTGADSFVKPGYFYRSSLWHVLGQTPHCRRSRAHWWSDEALDRVMRAIPHGEPARQVPDRAAQVKRVIALRRSAPQKTSLSDANRRVPARSDYFQPLPSGGGSKKSLYADLRAAVENTRKMETPEQ